MTAMVLKAGSWLRTQRWLRVLRFARYAWWGLGLGVGLIAWQVASAARPPIDDAHAYWAASLADPYRITAMLTPDAYHYGPPFLWLISPLKVLPFDLFRQVWVGLILLALAWLVGLDLFLPALLLSPFAADYVEGNIHILMAAAIVLSFRWPALWVFPIFTKAAGGIGILWFVFRGEWRNLAMAVGACAVVLGVSFLVVPGQWFGWFGFLADSAQRPPDYVAIPLFLRIGIAVVGLWGAARTGRRWFVPLAAMIVLPLWPFTVALVAGSVRLWSDDRRASDRSRGLSVAAVEADQP